MHNIPDRQLQEKSCLLPDETQVPLFWHGFNLQMSYGISQVGPIHSSVQLQ